MELIQLLYSISKDVFSISLKLINAVLFFFVFPKLNSDLWFLPAYVQNFTIKVKKAQDHIPLYNLECVGNNE